MRAVNIVRVLLETLVAPTRTATSVAWDTELDSMRSAMCISPPSEADWPSSSRMRSSSRL